MRIRLNHLVAVLSVAGFISAPVFAASTNNHKNVIYKKQPPKHVVEHIIHHDEEHPVSMIQPAPEPLNLPSSGPVSEQLSGKELVRIMSESQEYLPFDLDVPGQSFVSTGPYVGVPIQFAGGNLIVNSPSVNTDLQLLTIRKSVTAQLSALTGEFLREPYHSHLLFSGIIESQAQYFNFSNPENRGVPPTNIDLTNVTIDMTVFGPSEWILGFLELTYDNSSPINNGIFSSTSNFTVYNSRIYVNKAFVTLGNLACSPFYFTFGQYYVPFGVYSSIYVSDPLPKLIGRTKARAVEAAFALQGDWGFYGSAFVFRGDSHAPYISRINNGGLNLGLKYNSGPISLNIGGSAIANLADSVGLQFANNFQTFEQIVHRVPGYDFRFNLGIGTHWDFIGEYVTAGTRFNPHDMAYKGHGAKPSAFDIEGSYSFNVCNWPSAIGVGYGHSYQALAMGLPLSRYELVFNTSFFRNTLQSLEFRYDKQYARSITGASANDTIVHQTGHGDKAVIAQFDFYF